MLWTLRALLSEKQLNVTDWDYVLPAVQFVLNTRKSPVLDGLSPIKAATGIDPIQPTDIVLWKGPELQDAESMEIPRKLVAKYSAGQLLSSLVYCLLKMNHGLQLFFLNQSYLKYF